MQCADGHHLAVIALIAITLLFALILIAVAEFTKSNHGGGTDPFLRGFAVPSSSSPVLPTACADSDILFLIRPEL